VASSPQLFILEDVTGSGKTEAALFLACQLMTKKMGKGIFVALPTMATSNAMFTRLEEVYRRLFHQDVEPSLALAHGARHLSSSFMRSQQANAAHGSRTTGKRRFWPMSELERLIRPCLPFFRHDFSR